MAVGPRFASSKRRRSKSSEPSRSRRIQTQMSRGVTRFSSLDLSKSVSSPMPFRAFLFRRTKETMSSGKLAMRFHAARSVEKTMR